MASLWLTELTLANLHTQMHVCPYVCTHTHTHAYMHKCHTYMPECQNVDMWASRDTFIHKIHAHTYIYQDTWIFTINIFLVQVTTLKLFIFRHILLSFFSWTGLWAHTHMYTYEIVIIYGGKKKSFLKL